MASSTEISGAQPAAGRKPASASTTKDGTKTEDEWRHRDCQWGSEPHLLDVLYFLTWNQGFLHLLEVSFSFWCVFCTHVLWVRALWWTHRGSYDKLSFCVQPTLLRLFEQNQDHQPARTTVCRVVFWVRGRLFGLIKRLNDLHRLTRWLHLPALSSLIWIWTCSNQHVCCGGTIQS